MAPVVLAGRHLMPEFRQFLVEGLDRLGALPQQVFDEGLLVVLDRLLLQKEFLDGVRWFFFRHSEFLF